MISRNNAKTWMDGKFTQNDDQVFCDSDLVKKIEVKDNLKDGERMEEILVGVDIDPKGSLMFKLFKARTSPGHIIFDHKKKSGMSTLFHGTVWHDFLKPTKCTISGSKNPQEKKKIFSVGLMCEL